MSLIIHQCVYVQTVILEIHSAFAMSYAIHHKKYSTLVNQALADPTRNVPYVTAQALVNVYLNIKAIHMRVVVRNVL